jgi:hypothetical protein
MYILTQHFGWEAAHTAPAGEMRRMLCAYRIYDAYAARKHAKNWAKWAEMFPDSAELLNRAMLVARDNGDS